MTTLARDTLQSAVGSIEVHRGGSAGPAPLVYLHSAQGEGPGLALLEHLADSRLVVAPLFPGFGESEGLQHIDDIEDAAFHVLDVLDRLDLPWCDMVGLSLGGWMAAELCRAMARACAPDGAREPRGVVPGSCADHRDLRPRTIGARRRALR